MKKSLLIACTIFFCLRLYAQNPDKSDPDQRIEWWGDTDGYINQQAKVSLGLVNQALEANPPAEKISPVRKMALLLIDNVLHEEKAASRPAVQDFLHRRISVAIDSIRSARVLKGAVIWKLYNHAFVIKTPTVTLGFDIQCGLPDVEGFTLSRELVRPLLDVVDILFVSHYHRDHADSWVAGQMLEQGKPVVTPADIWSDLPIYPGVLHPVRNGDKLQEVSLPNKGIKLRFVTYPGHQGEKIPNNVYLVFTPEKLSFIHTGDQSNLSDFAWIDHVADHYRVDVAMVNSWSVYPEQRLAHGFRPGLIIAGHENEMGHTIDHREPFWLNELRLGKGSICPWTEMVWGEKFNYGSENR